MAQHNDLGKWGEQVAAEYLRNKGLYIRHMDWQDGHHRDLDIVAIDEDMSTLIVVEVKTRSTDLFGNPDEAIDLEKQNNIIKATNRYLYQYRLWNLNIRYDTVSIVGTPDTSYKITHKEGAFDILASYYYKEKRRKSARYRWKHRPGTW